MLNQWPPQYDRSYIPSPYSKFWNKDLETMDSEEREQTIILPKLQAQLRYAYEKAPLYKKKWDKAGVKPEAICSMEDFEQVPFITKEEISQDQKENPPFGSYSCVSLKDVLRLHGTSGTTGRPTVFGISKDDWERIIEAHARIMWGFGVREDDIVFIGSFFSLYMGSWGVLGGAERLGAVCFPFGAGAPGQTERAINWMKETKPTVFYGTPSYSLHIAERAKEMGVDPAKDFNFRILFFSGEPGAGIPSTKKLIEETYGGICIDSGSTAEMTPWMTNCECEYRQGMHLWQDIVYAELVDPVTKRRVPYGKQGVTVYTHLERTSQPMIRFWAGDISMWVNDPCPCGRTYPRLPKGIYGRVDDMFTIRGENVYPSTIEDVIRGIEGLGDEYQIIITREKAMDELVLQVEPTKGVESGIIPQLKQKLETELKKVLGIRAIVHLVEPDTLERTEFKAKRVIDKRGLYEQSIKQE